MPKIDAARSTSPPLASKDSLVLMGSLVEVVSLVANRGSFEKIVG